MTTSTETAKRVSDELNTFSTTLSSLQSITKGYGYRLLIYGIETHTEGVFNVYLPPTLVLPLHCCQIVHNICSLTA